MSHFRSFLAATAVMVISNGAAFAQDNPANNAVSAPVLKLDASGGDINGSAGGLVSASGVVPVGERFGAQADAEWGGNGDGAIGGVGGHFFYRQPESFLVGVTAHWATIDRHDVTRFGGETYVYLNDVTLSGEAGVQTNNSTSKGYVDLGAAYYVTNNLRVGVDVGAAGGYHYTGLEAEWQPGAQPFTVFGEAGVNDDAAGYGLVGVRYVINSNSGDLKNRNRHEYLPNRIHWMDTQVAPGVKAEYDRNHKPAAVTSGGYGGPA